MDIDLAYSAESKKIIDSSIKEGSSQLDLSEKDLQIIDGTYLAEQLMKHSKIQSVSLRSCTMNDVAMTTTIALIFKSSQIKQIDLSRNNIGTEEMHVLTQLIKQSQVSDLNLSWNNICDNGIQILAEGLKHSQVKELNVSGNVFGSIGLKTLTTVLKDTLIEKLNIYNCAINGSSANYLFENLKYSKLEYLDISINKLGSFENLSINLDQTKIKYLNLSSNEIDLKTLKSLSLQTPHKLSLDLSDNKIDDEGVEILANAIKNTSIEKLDVLDNSDITVVGLSALLGALNFTKITEFSLERFQIKECDADLLANALINLKIDYLKIHSSCFQNRNSILSLFQKLKSSIESDKSNFNCTTTTLDINFFDMETLIDDDLKCIVDALKYFTVDSFSLNGSKFTVHGIDYFISSVNNMKTHNLKLSDFEINLNNLNGIIQNTGIASLQLENCQLTDREAKFLAENFKYLINLRNLSLCINEIKDEGLIAIADNLIHSQIMNLNLSGNRFTNFGIEALDRVLNKYKLLLDLKVEPEFYNEEDSDSSNGELIEDFFRLEDSINTKIRSNNELYTKAKNFVELFENNTSIKYDKNLQEYVEAYEVFEPVLDKGPKSLIRKMINENFSKIV